MRAVLHLIDEPVPSLADPYSSDDRGLVCFRLRLPADGVTIWYIVAPDQGGDIITLRQVHSDE